MENSFGEQKSIANVFKYGIPYFNLPTFKLRTLIERKKDISKNINNASNKLQKQEKTKKNVLFFYKFKTKNLFLGGLV